MGLLLPCRVVGAKEWLMEYRVRQEAQFLLPPGAFPTPAPLPYVWMVCYLLRHVGLMLPQILGKSRRGFVSTWKEMPVWV